MALDFRSAKRAPLLACPRPSAVPLMDSFVQMRRVPRARSPQARPLVPANPWCLIQTSSLLSRANLPIITEMFG